MSVRSLLYVSKSCASDTADGLAIASLVTHARSYNLARQITGALLYTGSYFAQVLEGTVGEVGALEARIAVDQRHTDYIVLEDVMLLHRRFACWSMAFAGPSLFVANHVDRALKAGPGSGPATATLITLMQEYAT